MSESTTISPNGDLGGVREAIDAASGRRDTAEALQALAGIRKQLEQYLRLAEERMAALSRAPAGQESVVSDTGKPRTVEELARAFDRIGQRVAEDDASLSSDPDDYPLF